MSNKESRPLRAAAIGVGYLGKFHAQKYRDLAGVELVAVVDASLSTAQGVASELGAAAFDDYREVLDKVDVVSVVVPTPLHYAVAADFLKRGVHVLVEKPITETVEQAEQLIQLAREHRCVLQVGHLERFNPAVQAAAQLIRSPRFVESHRLAPFKQRGTDVSVVLDLMIHDIDLIQELVGRPIEHIDAVGSRIFSQDIDIANARIRFAGGCVVNTTASRVSLKQERKLRIFQDDAYISIDLQQKILTVVRKKEDGPVESPAQVAIEEQSLEQGDALRSEIEAFVAAVHNGTAPVVSGEDGLRALVTAMRISELVNAQGRIR
ncbi:MAG TPA: Gfo/Idh/MocA family oxidoreductase [Steroidobacteraceae bacterium]|nr:Gfo/Idh/MocA family oxidoreductase [Steroidobacteraceae bacterium]